VLGSRGNPGWLDLSDYVVHFTKGGDAAAYDAIMSILWHQVLRRGETPFGIAAVRHKVLEVAESQRSVCFSETPLGFLERVAKRRRSSYGIVFAKRFLLELGGAPLWYLEDGTAPQIAMSALIELHRQNGVDPNDPLWRITPLIDCPSGPTSPYRYDFRWEREWRVAADVSFVPSDVAALLIPEHNHVPAREFFEEHVADNTGPGYFCPYVDPLWPVDRRRLLLPA
jgi:hypothetical protein